MSTKDGSGAADQLIPGLAPADAAAPFAGDTRPLCDRKKVPLSAAQNAAAEFFLMTDVPVVANVSGVILNDLANEFNPNAPAFGEKFAPPWLPVAFYDWNGNVVNRVYADQFGKYNAVVPSTSTRRSSNSWTGVRYIHSLPDGIFSPRMISGSPPSKMTLAIGVIDGRK